jgi:hypothetical protein
VKCRTCGRLAAAPKEAVKEKERDDDEKEKYGEKEKDKDGKPAAPKPSTLRRAPALVDEFVFEPAPLREGTSNTEVAVAAILCVDHAHAGCERGFQAVSRLEQYAFLLNVALRRLFLLLKRRGVIPMSAGEFFFGSF